MADEFDPSSPDNDDEIGRAGEEMVAEDDEDFDDEEDVDEEDEEEDEEA